MSLRPANNGLGHIPFYFRFTLVNVSDNKLLLFRPWIDLSSTQLQFHPVTTQYSIQDSFHCATMGVNMQYNIYVLTLAKYSYLSISLNLDIFPVDVQLCVHVCIRIHLVRTYARTQNFDFACKPASLRLASRESVDTRSKFASSQFHGHHSYHTCVRTFIR